MSDGLRDVFVTLLVVAGVLILVLGIGSCVERRDNIVAECWAGDRFAVECALIKCQWGSNTDIECAAAFAKGL